MKSEKIMLFQVKIRKSFLFFGKRLLDKDTAPEVITIIYRTADNDDKFTPNEKRPKITNAIDK